jgi:outer membrane lipase/esterase
MKKIILKTAAVLGATAVLVSAFLTGCGSSDSPSATKPVFTSVVVFGSSLSDVGSYKAGSIASVGGGRYTVNPGKIWVEYIAEKAGVSVKPGMVGFAGQVSICPALPCTGWAQGGSRISNSAGIGKAQGLLTVPVVQQMDLQLVQKSSYGSSDLIVVASGSNDVYALADSITTAPASAQPQAIADARIAIALAGNELVDAIERKLFAKGASYVVLLTSDDVTGTPTATIAGPTNAALLTQFIKLLNDTVASGIASKKLNVLSIDTNSLTQKVLANPGNYGITNTSQYVCDPAKISAVSGGLVTTGSSLLCSANTVLAGANPDTWMYADSAHYATRMHKVLADFVIAELATKGWF